LERQFKAESVLKESARTEERFERVSRSPGRRKALKGKAQERWKLKEAFKGSEVKLSASG
jgi:hypothetical protein